MLLNEGVEIVQGVWWHSPTIPVVSLWSKHIDGKYDISNDVTILIPLADLDRTELQITIHSNKISRIDP